MRRVVDIPPARIGGGDAAHAARNVGPSQDYPCDVGTPVYAPFTVSRLVRWGHATKDDGGLAVTGYADNGDSFTVQHLSRRLVMPAADEGDVIAYSGNTGASTTGPHVHAVYFINGVRINPERALAAAAQPAGIQLPDTPEESMFIAIVRNTDWYLVTGGKACLLGAAAGARQSGAPILSFPDDWAVKQLKTVVTGIK